MYRIRGPENESSAVEERSREGRERKQKTNPRRRAQRTRQVHTRGRGGGGSPFRVGSRGHRPLVPLLRTIRREGPEAVGSLYLDSFTFLQQDSGVNLGHRKDVSDI